MTSVLHVITGLPAGGAELTLWRLLKANDPDRVAPAVVSLTPGGEVRERISALGIPVSDLGMRSAGDVPRALVHLRHEIRSRRVDVVQTWMHHADLVGGLAARSSGVPVVWGLRMSSVVAERRSTRVTAWLNARLAPLVPAAIVACSRSVADAYVARGHPRHRVTVIENGYDIGGRDLAAGRALRARLGISPGAMVVGRVGRWHPMKDYAGLLVAMAELMCSRPAVHLVLVGEGLDASNPELVGLLDRHPARDRVHLLGPQRDVLAAYSALDVLCSSSSSGEGFPNVIAEAMLAGVPVVTTDVGESAAIVGEAGRVVSPSSPRLLAAAIASILDLSGEERSALGRRGQESVEQRYGLTRMASAYADLHDRVARQGRAWSA
jgi:glycosyltransferase involved in cell wall biosynthesis